MAERVDFTPQPQAAMTVIETKHRAGEGNRGRQRGKDSQSHAQPGDRRTRQPGSTFKILSTYGPALEEEEITLRR